MCKRIVIVTPPNDPANEDVLSESASDLTRIRDRADAQFEANVHAPSPAIAEAPEVAVEPCSVTVCGKVAQRHAKDGTYAEGSEPLFRRYEFESPVDTERDTATWENGFLTVRMPKVGATRTGSDSSQVSPVCSPVRNPVCSPVCNSECAPLAFVPGLLQECEEKMRLIVLYSSLKIDALLSADKVSQVVKDLSWEMLVEHIREHGCHSPLPDG